MKKATVLAVTLMFVALVSNAQEKKSMPTAVKRVTPVLFVENVEPCLKFWEKLGFQRAMEVPDGNSLAFAAVQKDGTEIMYQSVASAMKDPSASETLRANLRSPAFLFIEITDLDTVMAALKGTRFEVEKHTTFYGSTEIGVRDPAGHFITFAEFPKK
jgi:uncharacterized glyoxalase superfamily protein PhnB